MNELAQNQNKKGLFNSSIGIGDQQSATNPPLDKDTLLKLKITGEESINHKVDPNDFEDSFKDLLIENKVQHKLQFDCEGIHHNHFILRF